MECADNAEALHNLFFNGQHMLSNNLKNSLMQRVVAKLDKGYQDAFMKAFPNFKL